MLISFNTYWVRQIFQDNGNWSISIKTSHKDLPPRIQLNKSKHNTRGLKCMGGSFNHNLSGDIRMNTGKQTIEERACSLARYIIDSKDTVRGAAKKFRY